ncbi:MAG TPA: alpha/beta fold hydrolase [Ramlibacter sp.]|jgi:pimeloyl-ACP methyl ester carboxylesterase|nr:alpha/beta fold hydrolase [Ramlibacter sp.]
MNAGALPLWDAVDAELGLSEPARPLEKVSIQRRRRRSYDAREEDGRSALDLTRDPDGVLRWIYQPPARYAHSGRRAYRAHGIDAPVIVKRFQFADLAPNQVTEALENLDGKLTPGRGLKRWDGAAWQPVRVPQINGRTLLLVHGTFSKGAMFSDELAATPAGRALFSQWQDKSRYAAMLCFDHPTLSVGPWSNAIDLMHAIAKVKGPIDIVCHSRGGLVVAWLLRLADVPVRRVVFVGSPLTGTSLASPYQLRTALDMLANVGDVLARGSSAFSLAQPLAAGAAGLARIFGKTLRLGSNLPIVDAAVALVPGLAAQQRIRNNLEIRQLFDEEWRTQPELSGIGVSFRPGESAEGWKFWRRFTHVKEQIAYSAADLVFPGGNDLVVDLEAMAQLGEKKVLGTFQDLGVSEATHHCSYFRDERVLQFMERQLR